jgi:uncharacterized membrane protein YqgA involved in biofilm formation
MIGTLINSGAIVLGAVIGLTTKLDVAVGRQQQIKVLLGVATAFFGLKLLWSGLAAGTVGHFFFQFLIVVIAMVLGSIVGKLCRIQALMNRVGQSAKAKLERAAGGGAKVPGDGFMTATLLFCAAPLGIVGALEDGLSRNAAPLAIKAVMDGLAALSFTRLFGWPVLLSAVPLGTLLFALTILGTALESPLADQGLLGVVHATAGLLLTYVALVIFEVKRVEIGNYLPALVLAPALMKLSRLLF